ncbi:MAG: hypothetical protein JWP29_3540 [Rhodoferax sp.]|nr:hypothetical protein [Rhodoferax sp.]
MAFLDMIFGINPTGTMIAALRLDTLSREVIELPSVATEYPVEDGSPISDAILPGAPKLSIEGGVSAASATVLGGALTGGTPAGKTKLLDAIAALQQVYAEHTPITIVTGLGVYPNMAMSSCRLTRSSAGPGGKWLDVQAEFIQIRKVVLKTTDVPADKVAAKTGATKAPAGKATATDPAAATADKGGSILKSLGKAVGLSK